jgi:hypothetical protein
MIPRPSRFAPKPPRPFPHRAGFCDGCGGPLPGGRRNWCSDQCVRSWMLLFDWATMCEEVLGRDQGRCQQCGWDVRGAAERIGRLERRGRRERYGRAFHGRCLGADGDVPLAGRLRPWTMRACSVPDRWWSEYALVWWHGWIWEFFDVPAPITPWDREAEDARRQRAVRALEERRGVAAYEFDHVIPLADGGEHGVGNLQVLCQRCHRAKTSWEAAARAREWPLLLALHTGETGPLFSPELQRATENMERLGYLELAGGRPVLTERGAGVVEQELRVRERSRCVM